MLQLLSRNICCLRTIFRAWISDVANRTQTPSSTVNRIRRKSDPDLRTLFAATIQAHLRAIIVNKSSVVGAVKDKLSFTGRRPFFFQTYILPCLTVFRFTLSLKKCQPNSFKFTRRLIPKSLIIIDPTLCGTQVFLLR